LGASIAGLPVVLEGTENIDSDILAANTVNWASRWDRGDVGELEVQGILQRVGLNTERGWYMNSETGELAKLNGIQSGWVQLDLYDSEHNWAFEAKFGYRGYTSYFEAQANSQAALVDKGFLNGVTWISVPDDQGAAGFTTHVGSELYRLGIKSGRWINGVGVAWYTF
jgi:hypothetical protein